MVNTSPQTVSELLAACQSGDALAQDRLVTALHDELHRMAEGLLRKEWQEHSIQPTELLDSAFVRLIEQGRLNDPKTKAYFFAAAARAMRQILIDHARRRKTGKRGANWKRLPWDAYVEGYKNEGIDLCELDDALRVFEISYERQSKVMELRLFSGLTNQQIARHLHISITTVESDFRFARAWLRSQIMGTDSQ